MACPLRLATPQESSCTTALMLIVPPSVFETTSGSTCSCVIAGGPESHLSPEMSSVICATIWLSPRNVAMLLALSCTWICSRDHAPQSRHTGGAIVHSHAPPCPGLHPNP